MKKRQTGRRQKIVFILSLLSGLLVLAALKFHFSRDLPIAGPDGNGLGDETRLKTVKLDITHQTKITNGSYRLTAECSYQGQPAGLQILLNSRWKRLGAGKKKPILYHGKVTYQSLGIESDRLVEMLNEYYRAGLSAKPMASQLSFTALVLEGDPRALEKTPVKLELINDPGNGVPRAEFFNQIDLDKGEIYFLEKDVKFRKPVVLALQENK